MIKSLILKIKKYIRKELKKDLSKADFKHYFENRLKANTNLINCPVVATNSPFSIKKSRIDAPKLNQDMFYLWSYKFKYSPFKLLKIRVCKLAWKYIAIYESKFLGKVPLTDANFDKELYYLIGEGRDNGPEPLNKERNNFVAEKK